MTKRIPLSRGKYALVSDCDYERVSQHKWCCDKNGYACRMESYVNAEGKRVRRKVLMHRFILDAPSGMDVDHRDGNRLDNRRGAIRLATRAQNVANASPRAGKYKGVSWHSRDACWRADITINGRKRYLGKFAAPGAAGIAYDVAAYIAWGEFAYLNLPHNKPLYQFLTAPDFHRSRPACVAVAQRLCQA